MGWILDNGNWYYYDENGKMAPGWLKENDKWYYLNSESVMQTGWQKIGGKWYYFYSIGSMAANTTIGGYRLGKDGAWIQ